MAVRVARRIPLQKPFVGDPHSPESAPNRIQTEEGLVGEAGESKGRLSKVPASRAHRGSKMLTQQHIADGLGLSLVHTNKTLRRLERRGLHRIADGRLFMRDVKALARLADLYGDGRPARRPLV